ncbi:MAG: helix-turn-helix domain-containing protein [Actinomycetota bacterium]
MSKSWSELRKKVLDSDDAKRGYEEARLAYDLSVQVREAREAKGLSQSQLAERMGTQQSVIARLEGGGITPTLPTLKRIADALGTKLTVGFEEPPVRRQPKAPTKTAAKRAVARTKGRRSG